VNDPSIVEAARARRRAEALLALALAVGTLLLFARAASFPFIHFDDNRYLTENPVVQRGLTFGGVVWAFTAFHVSNWHPLTWLSHMLDVEIFGLAPAGHHLVNVVLHAANVALLFVFLARTTGARWRSAFVAAVFAVHPLHVESVAWVAERKDVLSTFFGLLALLAYARYVARPRLGSYLAVLLAFALSLLAKPMWVTLPALLLLVDMWPLQRIERSPLGVDEGTPVFPRVSLSRALWEKVPLLALSGASSAVTVVAQHRGGAMYGLELGMGVRVANALVAYLRYFEKTIWPSNLSIFYPHPGSAPAVPLVVAGLVLLVAVTVGVIAAARRHAWAPVGWCWFLGTLVPVIGLVQVGAQAMANRYMYLPMIGVLIVLAWGAERVLRGRLPESAVAVVAVTVLVVLSAASWRELGYWTSHDALFYRALALAPESAMVHGVLSEGLRADGRHDEALEHAREAVRLNPTTVSHWNNLGVVLREAGRLDEARDAELRAISIDPAHASSWMNLGQIELDTGRAAEAEAALVQATRLSPSEALAWHRLGLASTASGDLPQAIDAYREAVRLLPDHLPSWNNLAVLYESAGQLAEALEAFETASRLDPARPAVWRNLGIFFARHGDAVQASGAFREALRLEPGNADVLRRLGRIYAFTGDRDGALAIAGQLAPLDPGGAAELRAAIGAAQ
jgi:tetratricopeptide (TPR) repeat protein